MYVCVCESELESPVLFLLVDVFGLLPSQPSSDAQQPEEEDDGDEQEEGVLPVVVAVVEVTVALVIPSIWVCSVKGIVGI